MSSSTIHQLHQQQEILWHERDNIENKLFDIKFKQDELNMQNCILKSNMAQEIGCTHEEYYKDKEEISSRLNHLEDEYYYLKNELHIINKKLKSIYNSLSEKIEEEIGQ
jgi:chaperonin cofactor prefoldin